MKRLLLALFVVVGLPASAFAAQYHIFQGMVDQRCRVVDTIPKELGVILGGPSGFATREQAEAELPKLCKQGQSRQERQAQQEPVAGQRYHIFQGMVDKRCRVVDAVPNEIGVIFGGPSGFATRAEAEAELPEICKQK